ncbi:hypothetical protein C8R43DRAFT_1235295 [Mycena crocata]|nr:hypothetical protein C8R43DRAFT_1235295 [Mycena crocata]
MLGRVWAASITSDADKSDTGAYEALSTLRSLRHPPLYPAAMQLDSALKQLRTGYVPSVPESVGIQANLASLSDELARLEALIRDLSSQRDKVQESIELQRALIAPIRRLPDDVLRELFLACLPTHRNAAMSPVEPPLLLCRICSVWRALALATPMLWASLHTHIDFILPREDRAHAVAQWVGRSAACPLSLSMSGTFLYGFTEVSPWVPDTSHNLFLGTLVQPACRWRNISLKDLPPVFAEQSRGVSTPLLQVIHIRESESIARWLNLIASPGVRKVFLEARVREEVAMFLIPRMSSVTHLSITPSPNDPWKDHGISSNTVVNILRSLTQSVSLQLKKKIQGIDTAAVVANATMHLPLLESLALEGSHIRLPLFSDLLEQLVMPRLRHLCLSSAEASVPDSHPYFASLRERSPLIYSLDINLDGFTCDTLRTTLSNFPSLSTLAVRDEPNPSPFLLNHLANTKFLFGLLANLTQHDLLPALRVLETTCSKEVVDDQTLFRFLHNRVDVGGRFRLNLIYFYVDASGFPDVDWFRFMGLDISLAAQQRPSVDPAPDAWAGLPADSESMNG